MLGILLPISGFVAMGFEHFVANMFFLPMGLTAKLLGFGAEAAGAGSLDVLAIAYNLSVATLGNVLGGSLFVALAYWYLNAKHPFLQSANERGGRADFVKK